MQAFMRQYTVRMRMMGAIAAVLVLLGAVGGAGWWGMGRLSQVAQEFTDNAFRETLTLSQLKSTLGAMTSHEKDMVIAYERPEQVLKAKALWKAEIQKTGEQIEAMLAGEEDGDNDL